jgi:hypothetical protein
MARTKRVRSRSNRGGISTIFSAVSIEVLAIITFLTLLSAIRGNQPNSLDYFDQSKSTFYFGDSQLIEPPSIPPITLQGPNRLRAMIH